MRIRCEFHGRTMVAVRSDVGDAAMSAALDSKRQNHHVLDTGRPSQLKARPRTVDTAARFAAEAGWPDIADTCQRGVPALAWSDRTYECPLTAQRRIRRLRSRAPAFGVDASATGLPDRRGRWPWTSKGAPPDRAGWDAAAASAVAQRSELTAASVMHDGTAQLVGHVILVAPVHHSQTTSQSCSPFGSSDTGLCRSRQPPSSISRADQQPQAFTQNGWRNVEMCAEVAEAHRPVKRITDDQQCPPLADHFK